MKITPGNLRLHAGLYVLFVLSVVSGTVSLIGNTWPQLPVPHGLMVTTQGALALVFGGLIMLSLMMRWRKLQRISAGLLIVLASYNIIHNVLAGPNDSGLSIFTGQPRLQFLPAVCVILIAIVALLGIETRRRQQFATAMGLFGVIIGGSIFVMHLPIHPESGFILGFNHVSAFFCLTLSIALIILAWPGWLGVISINNAAAFIGGAGILGTFILMLMASWGIHAEQHRAATALVDHHATMLSRELGASSDLIKRLANRWATFSFAVPETFHQVELASYFNDIPALQSLVIVDDDQQVVASESRSQQERVWLEGQMASTAASSWRQASFLNETSSSSSAVWIMPDTQRPLMAILITVPDQASGGIVYSSFSIDSLLQPVMHLPDEDFHVTLQAAPSEAISSVGEGYGFDHEIHESVSLPMTGDTSLLVTASGGTVSFLSLRGALLPCILGFGLLASYLLTAGRGLLALQQRQSRELSVGQQRFRSLFSQSPDAVFEFSKDGRYLSLNPQACAITGISDLDLGVLSYDDVLSQETMSNKDYHTFDAAFKETIKGEAQTFSVNFLNVKGQRRDYECSFIPVIVDDTVAGLYAVVKDVTERLQALESQRLLTKSLESSDSAVLVFDVRQPTIPAVFANDAFTRMTGYERNATLNNSLFSIANSIEADTDVDRIKETIASGKAGSFTVKSYRRDGTLFWNQLSLAPVKNDDGVVTHYTAIMKDVSEKKEQESQLAYQATHDVLTGLANRSMLEDRLEHDIALAQRNGEHLAVLFIDLDEFKPINDTLGHRIGDEVLISVAQRMQTIVRATDTLARFGGDEFVLLLPNLKSEQEAELMADQILSDIGRAHQVNSHELYVTASIGISVLSDKLSEPHKLLQQADMAMYKAKQQGRDTYVVFSDDLDVKLLKRVTLRNELQEALKTEQLFLNYQPQVDQLGKICGLEALVRWRHPVKGMISPAEFIPVAEETGQIIHLGRWVTSQACRDAKQLLDLGMLNSRVAVNLSPLQFHRPGFLDSLRDVLRRTALPPAHLELELTEGILMHDSHGAVATLRELAALGIATSIDDFGTGYSSFSYLKDLPVNSVKIDKSFINNISMHNKDAAVCKGIITMAKEMGIKVVAEGVETQEQFEILKGYGCKVFQGFLFARPMAIQDLIAWMQKNSAEGA